MIPAGNYKAKALEAVLTASEVKKTPCARVLYEIIEEGPFKGRKLTWDGYMTPKTTERVKESLRLSNVDLSALVSASRYVVGTPSEVTLVVTLEPMLDRDGKPTGKQRNRVNWVNGPGTGGMAKAKELDEAERSHVAAMLGVELQEDNGAPF